MWHRGEEAQLKAFHKTFIEGNRNGILNWENGWRQAGAGELLWGAGARSEEQGYRMRGWEVSGADIMSVSGMSLKRINTDLLLVWCHCYWITEKTDVMTTVMCNVKHSYTVDCNNCVEQIWVLENHQALIFSAESNKHHIKHHLNNNMQFFKIVFLYWAIVSCFFTDIHFYCLVLIYCVFFSSAMPG